MAQDETSPRRQGRTAEDARNPYRPEHLDAPRVGPRTEPVEPEPPPSPIRKKDQLHIDLMAARGDGAAKVRRYLQLRGYTPEQTDAALEELGYSSRDKGRLGDLAVRIVGLLLFLGGLALLIVATILPAAIAAVGLVLLIAGRNGMELVARGIDRFMGE
jgi:hypothetical protein